MTENSRIRLLITDEYRVEVENNLRGSSFDLQSVDSLEELLQQWNDLSPDLIVCDGTNAADALQAVHTLNPDLPVIVVSGDSDSLKIAEYFREGAADWIPREDLTGLRPGIEHVLQVNDRTSRPAHLIAAALENIPIGLTLTDLEGRILYTNNADARMHGYQKEELLGRDARTFAPNELWRLLPFEKVSSFRRWKRESINVRQDGSVFAVQVFSDVVRNEKGEPLCIVTLCEDISERKALQPDFYDSLTGLPTRELFMDRLGRAVKRSKRRADYTYAVFYIDLDRFKSVNDMHGREIGNRVLAACARRIEACVRFGDTVGRLDEDKFAVLLEDIRSIQDAGFVADRIQQQLILPFDLESNQIFITASIGIVEGRASYDRPEEILKNAKSAAYRSKAMGRARNEVFDPSMESLQDALKPLEIAIHRALDKNEFFLEYQPILSIETREICALEAFVRWHRPDRGVEYPQEFVPIAEGTRQMPVLENWVLQNACKEVKALQNEGFSNLVLCINLSASQLAQPDLIRQIRTALQESELDPSSLEVEISERMIPISAEVSLDALQKLHDEGLRLSIDDFGTGQTSLGHLSQLPIHTLKIDNSLIREITPEPDEDSVVPTAIALAHELNLNVVAEGVETEGQLLFLRRYHCDMAQGYFFSPSLSAEKILELLKSKS